MKLNGYASILFFCVIALSSSGCDLVKGAAIDISSNAKKTVSVAINAATVSDLQKSAEAMCIEALNTRPILATYAGVVGGKFSDIPDTSARIFHVDEAPSVTVQGYKNYLINVRLSGGDPKHSRTFGMCRVENGKITELSAGA